MTTPTKHVAALKELAAFEHYDLFTWEPKHDQAIRWAMDTIKRAGEYVEADVSVRSRLDFISALEQDLIDAAKALRGE